MVKWSDKDTRKLIDLWADDMIRAILTVTIIQKHRNLPGNCGGIEH